MYCKPESAESEGVHMLLSSENIPHHPGGQDAGVLGGLEVCRRALFLHTGHFHIYPHLVNKSCLSLIRHSYSLGCDFHFLPLWQDKAPISQERKWLFISTFYKSNLSHLFIQSFYTCADINLFPWKEILPLENAFGIFESSGWYLNTDFHGSYWRVPSLTWEESRDCEVICSLYFTKTISSHREKNKETQKSRHRETPRAEQSQEREAPKGWFSVSEAEIFFRVWILQNCSVSNSISASK